MRFKNIMLLLFTGLILLSGCTPYNMLDDEGKITYVLNKYKNYIRKDKMEDAYSLLTFVHHPERDNFEMFKLAQGLINRNYKKVEYEINEINIDENVASVKVDIIFVPPTKDRPHIKVESQMFFYKPENSEIWFLVSGNQDSRMLFIQKISDKFPLIEDKTLYLKDGSWVEEL